MTQNREADENEIANNKVFFCLSFHFRLPPRSAILLNVHIEMNWKIKPFGTNKQQLQQCSATDNFTFAYKHLSREISQLLLLFCFVFDVTFYFKKKNVSGVVLLSRGKFFHHSAQSCTPKPWKKETLESTGEM